MRIRVEPPAPEVRRERVEKRLFARLAAVEMAERVTAVLPLAPRRRMPYVLGAAVLAAAVIAIVLLVGRDPAAKQIASEEPSRVVTPVGGESRFIVGDAVIDAKSDTSVEVRHGDGGAITLVLARGAVDCDVEPRHGRPPFRVLAGDATVEVVGTRFTVTRTPSLRVDVARGKVKVTTPAGTNLVEAGESWPVVTAEVPAPAPVAEPALQPAPEEVSRPVPVESKITKPKAAKDLSQQSYREALRLEATDPKKAAELYRTIATESKSLAAVALVSLAQVELEQLHDARAALAATDEHAKRFPGAATGQDASWLRYQALLALGKRDEARGAAADYLRQFPHGAYADRLQK